MKLTTRNWAATMKTRSFGRRRTIPTARARPAQHMKQLIDENPSRAAYLFRRGYLVSTHELPLDGYPFYGNWITESLGNLKDGRQLHFYRHRDLSACVRREGGTVVAIIGHAYDPFTRSTSEVEIIDSLASSFSVGDDSFLDKVSELTGIHLILANDNGRVVAVQDCTGMRSCYYLDAREFLLTSHPQLVGDLFELPPDRHVADLKSRWFFSLSGRYLPGDLSPFQGLKRLGPNHILEFSESFRMRRFFPLGPHMEIGPTEYGRTIDDITQLISTNIELCALKWDRPVISLSGGVDSRTTIACATPHQDKFGRFSFHAKPQEIRDAAAARDICDFLGLSHTTYAIPDDNAEVDDFDAMKAIIAHNASYIGRPGDHEIRKFIFFSRLDDFDVELKSWVSEIGRAMWERKYGFSLPDRLTPRHFNIFQTRYIGAPRLMWRGDRSYESYLRRSGLLEAPFNYDHQDMFYWEFRFGSWGSGVKTIQDIFNHEVTMPMNNRKLMDMFLAFPHDFRGSDSVNRSVIERANSKLADFSGAVHNDYLGGRRVKMEKVYFLTHGFSPVWELRKLFRRV